MKFLNVFIVFSALFLASLSCTYSQDIDLSINDTTINRGGINIIQINFASNGLNSNKFISEYTFNANVIDIKNNNTELAQNDYIDSIHISTDLSNLSESVLKISVLFKENFPSSGSINIAVEGLAGSDTVTFLTPVKALVDNIEIENVNFIAGRISVNSSIIVPGITEGLYQNRPNPFSDYTAFPFGLNKDSEISFSIYGHGGRNVYNQSKLTDIFKVAIIDENGEVINDFKDKILKRGNYKLTLQPYSWQLASGAYYIVMTTESGAYKTNFIYIK
jgi:hypothetical protein